MAHAISSTQTPPDELARFREIVSKFHTAMFVSQGNEIGMHARPMAVARMDEDGTLWFVTGGDTRKVGELATQPEALVCLQNEHQFATINGRVNVVQDRRKLEELWSESFRLWFDGKDDPNLVLLQLVPSAGEYWDQSGIRGLRYAFGAAKAYVSRERIDVREQEPGIHGSVKLRP